MKAAAKPIRLLSCFDEPWVSNRLLSGGVIRPSLALFATARSRMPADSSYVAQSLPYILTSNIRNNSLITIGARTNTVSPNTPFPQSTLFLFFDWATGFMYSPRPTPEYLTLLQKVTEAIEGSDMALSTQVASTVASATSSQLNQAEDDEDDATPKFDRIWWPQEKNSQVVFASSQMYSLAVVHDVAEAIGLLSGNCAGCYGYGSNFTSHSNKHCPDDLANGLTKYRAWRRQLDREELICFSCGIHPNVSFFVAVYLCGV